MLCLFLGDDNKINTSGDTTGRSKDEVEEYESHLSSRRYTGRNLPMVPIS